MECTLLRRFHLRLLAHDWTFLSCGIGGGGGGGAFRGKRESGKEHPYSCVVLGGARSMDERRAALAAFKDGDVRFLIATDVAARGLDIQVCACPRSLSSERGGWGAFFLASLLGRRLPALGGTAERGTVPAHPRLARVLQHLSASCASV